MSINQLQEIVNNLTYGYGNIISKNDNYVLTKPRNTYDTNYKLHDKKENTVYLIDCEDVQFNVNDLEEYGGILYSELLNLNIDEIKDSAWKIEVDHVIYG